MSTMRGLWAELAGPSGSDADAANGKTAQTTAGAASGAQPPTQTNVSAAPAPPQKGPAPGNDTTHNDLGDKIISVDGKPVNLDEENQFQDFKKWYDIALQGTSGQYEPAEAAKVATQIAEKANAYLEKKFKAGDANDVVWRNVTWPNFQKFFEDALQGTASQKQSPDQVVNKAGEAAERSISERAKERAKIHWQHADLPAPMDADCKVVAGKVKGPKNHSLCGTHDHVVDTDSKMVIAHSLEEYKKLFPQ